MEIQKYDLATYLRTDGLTWVGARDTCVSKNDIKGHLAWNSLHQLSGISYTDPKLKNNLGLPFSTFHVEQPETLIEWK